MSTRADSTAPRTLAEQLRGWSDEQLATMLRARPDLAHPAPQDVTQLAARVGVRASVLRALDQLNRLELVVLDALVAVDGRAPQSRLLGIVSAETSRAEAALRHLRDVALVWGTDDDLRVVSAVSDTLGTTTSGLGPPAGQLLASYGPEPVADLLSDLGGRPSGDRASDVLAVADLLASQPRVEALVAACDEAAQEMLRHLDGSGSRGASDLTRAPVRLASARSPVQQLVARGLLLPQDRQHLAVPREVGIALRGGRTMRSDVGEPPPVASTAKGQRLVDHTAAGAAYELVHQVELLLDRWGEQPPAVLRQGGLAVRDLRAAAELLNSDDRGTALVVEISAAAGLLTQGNTAGRGATWLPTTGFDRWASRSLSERWAVLADAWLGGSRLIGLVGAKFQGRTVNALAGDLEREWLPAVRRMTLEEVAALPEGSALAPEAGVLALVARLRWLRPRRPPSRDEAVAWSVEEAGAVGVLGLGGMPGHGRALLASGPEAAAEAIEGLMPQPVDHVVLQADLTAVAPGPLEQTLARDLATVAEVESRGGATVYRFTDRSIRHALDIGWSAVEVRDTITGAARTEVPQALSYLIDDVARRHGTVRIGTAETFVRSDDEASLTAVLHDPRAAALGLRRIAPTVLVSDEPAEDVLPLLRELGIAPVVEGPEGGIAVGAKESHRVRTPAQGPSAPLPHELTAKQAAATVRAIRSGERAAAEEPGSTDRQSPAAALALLQEAAESGATVAIGYVGTDGSAQHRVVEPRRVDGGWLAAFDQRAGETRSFAVHRIGSVRVLGSDPDRVGMDHE